MKVTFGKNILGECFENKEKAQVKWGEQIAELYIKRISLVQAANSIDDLFKFPQLKFHRLKGNLKNYYSIKITGRARIYVTVLNQNSIVIEKVDLEHYEK